MANDPKDFYVGYLTLPPRLKWALSGLVALLLALVAFDAWLVATLQPEAGDGKWAEAPKQFTGTLWRAPYPTLRVTENGEARTYVLISDEKRGAEAALEGIADGAQIKLDGYLIERAAVLMVQLAANDVAVAGDVPATPEAAREIHGRVTLSGEIVDSKCWLGVMRPGEGLIHKACAALCIRGGIPPMFVARASDGPKVMLLTLFDGRAVPPEAILDFVADHVELSGVIEKRGDLFVFKVDLSTLKRLA